MDHTDRPQRHILILGGTAEARELADLLLEAGYRVTSSLAGRVARPKLPAGEVRLGGFGGPDGLAEHLVDQRIDALVDATHPFATTITESAIAATRRTGTPLVGIRRPRWVERPGQEWHRVTAVAGAARLLQDSRSAESPLHPGVRRVMLTTGRRELAAFAALDEHWFLIRTVDPPLPPLPSRHELLLDRGPYTVDGERDLMQRHRIQALVTKDSGGDMTVAKLDAAQQLGIAVIVVDRPPYPLSPVLDSAAAAVAWLASQVS